MIRSVSAFFLAVAILLAACSSSNSGTPSGGGSGNAVTCANPSAPIGGLASESSSFGCDKPLALHGDAGAGGSCQSSVDCTPTCCACPAGKHFKESLAAACVGGQCVDSQTVCCAFTASVQDEPDGGTGPCD